MDLGVKGGAMNLKKGDHLLVGHNIEDGTKAAIKVDQEGNLVERFGVAEQGSGAPLVRLERCHGVMQHVVDIEGGHPGPPRYNCDAYRVGYDRIFGRN